MPLKRRIAEKLDEINPLIGWYLRYFCGCYISLVILGIGAVLACFALLHYFQVGAVDSLAAMEIFFSLLSLALSLLFLYPTIDCLDNQTKQDELYRLRCDTPLERLHCHMAVMLVPLFLAWLVPLPFILVPTFCGGSFFKLFALVSMWPLCFSGYAFIFLSQKFDTAVFGSKISLSGFPAIIFAIGWFAIFVNTTPNQQAGAIFLLIALPCFCGVTYQLLRKTATEKPVKAETVFFRNLLVYAILAGALFAFWQTIKSLTK